MGSVNKCLYCDGECGILMLVQYPFSWHYEHELMYMSWIECMFCCGTGVIDDLQN